MLLALLLGTVLAALVTEAAFRLVWQLPAQFAMFEQAGMYVATADGGTGLRPGFHGVIHAGEARRTEFTVNELGMRGEHIAERDNPLLIGFVVGLPVVVHHP